MRRTAIDTVLAGAVLSLASLCAHAEETPSLSQEKPDFARDVAPLLTKYCTACHNADDAEGKLNLESYAGLEQGGARGPAMVPGESENSRLVRVLTGKSKPVMPPEGSDKPSAEEIAVLSRWIDGGARGPEGTEPDRQKLITPEIKPAIAHSKAIASLAFSPDGKTLAVARFGTVELRTGDGNQLAGTLGPFPGKVTAVHFSRDGQWLVAASGVAGLYGHASLWKMPEGKKQLEVTGHRDLLYDAELSPDGKLLATASYDQKIILWDVAQGQQLRTFDGHNGAVYDLAFHGDGNLLFSASGDETVKVWHVADGERLDTRSEPLAEQYTVAASPGGKYFAAGGVDNRIRVWRLASRHERRINPIMYARFAHETAITKLVFSPDGKILASVAEDRLIKLWDTAEYTQVRVYPKQPDQVAAIAFSPAGEHLAVGRLDGSLELLPVRHAPAWSGPGQPAPQPLSKAEQAPLEKFTEQEPNDQPQQATQVQVPAEITGVVHAAGDRQQNSDEDSFRFSARQGERLILEVKAARNGSPLDAKIAVLHPDGEPVERLQLRAVRDTYITFRGIDSDNRQFRLHNWEEMDLNQYLYASGEVVKLFLAPRGPDSGFDMYPHTGARHTFFDTTAISHPLHEPCYIVEPHPPGASLPPNGLPVFKLYYENDDDGLRRYGADSHLTFTAPEDGDYLVRLRDVRGEHGPEYKYTLSVRPARPDFKVSIGGKNPKVPQGSGQKLTFNLTRIDGFDGPVRIDIEGLPPGIFVTTPITIQAGHYLAEGAIYALPGTEPPSPEQLKQIKVTATADVGGERVQRNVGDLGTIEVAPRPKVLVRLLPPDAANESPPEAFPPPELVIAPGDSITAELSIQRHDFGDRIRFDPRNLPHGVIVDNIGLNGVLIPAGETQRTIFLTAESWVPETSRLIYLEAQGQGNQTSLPVLLHVRRPAGGGKNP